MSYVSQTFRFLLLSLIFCFVLHTGPLPAQSAGVSNDTVPAPPVIPADTTGQTVLPVTSSTGATPSDFIFDDPPVGPIILNEPDNIVTEVHYDPATNQYYKIRKMGDRIIGRPQYITFEQYLEYDMDQALQRYWNEKSQPQEFERQDGIIPQIYVGGEVFDRIFGGSTIDIRPTGSAELIFGVLSNRREDPQLDERRRQQTNFDFQQKIQLSVQAKIGEKIELQTNYDTEASFDFENKMKLEYRGNEDEILQLIEAGDVTLPLPGTLITGNQGLFGFKTQMRFGHTTVTSVFSQQRTESKSIEVQGGAQTTEYEFKADEYDENRHYFLGHYFRDQYDDALSSLPIISSNIVINKIEVWVTNIGAATEDNRNIVAFSDLGESSPYRQDIGSSPNPAPSNQSNNLYATFENSPIRDMSQVNKHLGSLGYSAGTEYESIENARRLDPNEYTFNAQLGFISLNQSMSPDHVLAVAFEYTIIGDETIYQVGEFSTDVAAPSSLIVKLLKSTSINTNHPMWDLMMKNVYSIGAFQVNREDFRLNILYEDEELGVPIGFLSEGPVEGEPLIRVMGLDRLNTQMDPVPDGVFDFIDNAATQGGTIEASNGRIYFPVVEPFGSHLREMLEDPDLADKYAFDSLYTTTKTIAQQFPEQNRFILEGRYKSASGSEIPLNAINIPPGSVVVTAGGVPLTENTDYTVDYTLGRVRIINEGILNSGTPIRISLESSSLFNIQTKTLMGTHIDHWVNENLNVGATIMRLSERPLTQKVNYGDEPIANTIWGLNATYQTESLFITRMLDKLPFYSSTAPSRITFVGEFAHLIPGHSRLIGSAGTAYIDDFEGSKSSIDLKNIHSWHIASTPQFQTQPDMFPEGAIGSGLAFRFNNALMAWYIIDRLFWDNNNLTPAHIRNDPTQQSNHYVREVRENEIWPNKDNPSGIPAAIPVLNIAYYPSERGMYNFDSDPSPFSAGLAQDGSLRNPESRWGGIMRAMQNPDFEASNIEYIEFWVLDPFIYDPDHEGGDMYFNLGDISEDVLRDGRKAFENGLPTTDQVLNVDTTIWGRVPNVQSIVDAFDNDPATREFQDIGLNGLNSEEEISFYDEVFLERLATLYGTNSQAYLLALEDAAADDYQYFRGSELDQEEVSILDRYKRYNGLEGNSPTSEMSPEPYPTQATNLPNSEDINLDGTLNESERYWQYKVSLRPEDMVVGKNYITDVIEARVTLKNGENDVVNWYQFKIPLRDPNRQAINEIQDFKSIRFMRMFLKGFEQPIFLRFAALELVRGNWRTFDRALTGPGEYIPNNNDDTSFEVFTVNIEENGTRSPIPYVLPPGIEREQDLGTTSLQRRNEQSLAMRTTNLKDGDARAVFKTADLDMRQYRRIRMFAHAEPFNDELGLNDNDLTVFIRLGSDFTNNYYEYEVPMKVTPWGTGPIRELVWPEDNEFDIHLEKLTNLKLIRNKLSREAGSGVSLNNPYWEYDGENRMTVIGTPTLSNVKVIMIGVRNPRKTFSSSDDDGLPKSAEIWLNELRLYEFEDQGGWAATGRMNTQLADLGNLTVVGFTSTPGFGSIEQKVNDRSKEFVNSYDIASNLELGKFFPEDFGVRIPFHFSFSESFSDPQYNPLNPDILFKDDLASYATEAERDSIRSIARDYVRRKSFNFSNVGKSRLTPGGKNRFYDIENFDFTYNFSEIYARNIDVEYDTRKLWRGAIGYNWQLTPTNVTPFANIGIFSGNAFRIIRDFNFYYLPRLVSLRTTIDRGYAESLMRDKSQYQIILEPNFVKTFSWDRLYDIRYDLTRALKLEFQATNNARIDEPPGRINRNDENYAHMRDSILNNIRAFGRTTFYNHRINITYNVPVNKLPLLDWITANAGYTANYDWQAAPLAAQQLGNTVENANTKRLNVNANLVNLYNKVGFLREINQQGLSRTPQRPQQQRPQQDQEQDQEAEDEEAGQFFKTIYQGFFRILMGFRNFSVNYSETNGTRLPGFQPESGLLGMSWDFEQDYYGAPGIGFIFGSQEDIRGNAIRYKWITDDPMLNQAYVSNLTQNINARSQFEPLPNMRIEFTALRNYARSLSEYFKADEQGTFDSYSPQTTGNFSISFLSISTAFEGTDDANSSLAFENFKAYRLIIAKRLAEANPNQQDNGGVIDSDDVFPSGYGPTSQEVLIPAFMAAYGGWDPNKSETDPFLKIPMPNWRLTYDGLSKIEGLKRYFQTITIAHGYRSTFSIGSYRSNARYEESDQHPGFPAAFDDTGNFISPYEISQVSISEQFSPLISFDMTWVNSLMTRFEYRSSRNIGLSFANNQITDVTSREIIIGTGYRFQDLAFNLAQGNNTQRIQSDLVLRLDLAFRRNMTVLRRIVEERNEISAGQNFMGINFSADYQVSPRVTMRLFYDRNINNPFISKSFPTSNTHAGFSFRFMLI
ncbi:MAG: cell surface protein SprA [Bacteroidota bacterium]